MPRTIINVVLFGIGNVGSTLVQQIQDHQKSNSSIELRIVALANSQHVFFAQDASKNAWKAKFDEQSVPYRLQDILDVLEENDYNNLIAVDATASEELVDHYEELIAAGCHLVTANKKANTRSQTYYNQLREWLRLHQREFRYETNVGAGLPVVASLSNLSRSGEKILQIEGVFSGSLSYILNRVHAEDLQFSEALQQAAAAGYTEPDFRDDLSGTDVARKLLILARELGFHLELDQVEVQSLVPYHLLDLPASKLKAQLPAFNALFEQLASDLKPQHRWSYLGTLDVQRRKLRVGLQQVPVQSPLGNLRGADNLVQIQTENYRQYPIVIQGPGAGREVTARGVLSDILEVAAVIQQREAVVGEVAIAV